MPMPHRVRGRAWLGGLGHTRPATRWAVLAMVFAVQVAALYLPGQHGPSTSLPLDKVVHFALFAAVAAVAVWAGVRPCWVLAVLALQAVASELVQQYVLTDRGGEWGDLAADLLGTLGGIWAGRSIAAAARRQAQ